MPFYSASEGILGVNKSHSSNCGRGMCQLLANNTDVDYSVWPSQRLGVYVSISGLLHEQGFNPYAAGI